MSQPNAHAFAANMALLAQSCARAVSRCETSITSKGPKETPGLNTSSAVTAVRAAVATHDATRLAISAAGFNPDSDDGAFIHGVIAEKQATSDHPTKDLPNHIALAVAGLGELKNIVEARVKTYEAERAAADKAERDADARARAGSGSNASPG